MEIIILDTSIFVKENFLKGRRIKSFLDLSKRGIIEIYITEITYNEIINNFVKHVEQAVLNHNTFKNKNYILKNDSNLKNLFKEIDTDSVKNIFIENLNKLIDDHTIKIIPYTKLNIKTVFDKYFECSLPFGKANKKTEFPDAFSLELIDDFLKKNKSNAIMLSTDNDFKKCSSSLLKIRNDYEKYLDEKFKEIKFEIIDDLFHKNIGLFSESFINWFQSNMDDYSLYYEVVNFKEIYDLEIDSNIVGKLDYSIISFKDNIVVIEVIGYVDVEVRILTDDEDTMYYDSDDKSYHYFDTKYETFRKSFKSKIIASTEIISEEEYYEDFEIESINDNMDLNFEINNNLYSDYYI